MLARREGGPRFASWAYWLQLQLLRHHRIEPKQHPFCGHGMQRLVRRKHLEDLRPRSICADEGVVVAGRSSLLQCEVEQICRIIVAMSMGSYSQGKRP